MTKQIGPFDFVSLHLVVRDPKKAPELYERRKRFVIVASTGEPRRPCPDGLTWQARERMKQSPTDKIVEAWVLAPVGIQDHAH